MSARAWHARRENKRFKIALKRGIKSFKSNPLGTVYLEEWGLVLMSPERHAELMDQFRLVETLNKALAWSQD